MLNYDFCYKLSNGAELTVKVVERDCVRAGEKARKELTQVVGRQSAFLLGYSCNGYIADAA